MEYTDENKVSLSTGEYLGFSYRGYMGARFRPDEAQKISIALDLVGRETLRISGESIRERAERSNAAHISGYRREAAWRLSVIEEYDKLQAEKKTPPEWETEEALEALALYNSKLPVSTFKNWSEIVNNNPDAVQATVNVYVSEVRRLKEAKQRLAKRRNKLVQDHVGGAVTYAVALPSTRSLVDRVIELEDAQ